MKKNKKSKPSFGTTVTIKCVSEDKTTRIILTDADVNVNLVTEPVILGAIQGDYKSTIPPMVINFSGKAKRITYSISFPENKKKRAKKK